MAIADTEFRSIINNLRKGTLHSPSIAVFGTSNELDYDVAVTISALSNTSGGVMLFGIDAEDGIEVSEDFDSEAMTEKLLDLCAHNMKPPAHIHIAKRSLRGADVLIAQIDEIIPREKPCVVTGLEVADEAYVREEDGTNRDLTSFEIRCLEASRVQPRDDIEIVREASFEDLNSGLVDDLVSRRKATHPRLFAGLSKLEILLDLHVVEYDEEGVLRPTLAGLVALGVYPQKFFPRLAIRFTKFNGLGGMWSEETEAVESKKFLGPAPIMVEEAVQAIHESVSAERFGLNQYPKSVLYELLCNAVMHRDYSTRSQSGHIIVNLYDDCLEVTSPGGLYGLATTDKLESRNTSYTRNQFLADILEATPYDNGESMAPQRGTGFMNMRAELTAVGMATPALFDQITHFKVVVFKAHDVLKDAPKRIGRKDSEVIEYLRRTGEATATELEEETGLSRRTLNYKLHKLVEQGLIERTGSVHSPKQSYRLL